MSNLFSIDRMPERSLDGQFSHPDLDQFFDGEEGPLNRERLLEAGYVVSTLYLNDDDTDDAHLVAKGYEEGELNLSGWKPHLDGWLTVGIWDTENGPIAFFVKGAA